MDMTRVILLLLSERISPPCYSYLQRHEEEGEVEAVGGEDGLVEEGHGAGGEAVEERCQGPVPSHVRLPQGRGQPAKGKQ